MEFRRAELLYHGGRYGAALDAYRELAGRRLERRLRSDGPWLEADLVLLERLAELSVLLGRLEAADSALAAGVEICRRAGDRYGGDYMAVKRIQVLLGQGRLREGSAQLTALAPSLGEIDRIDPSPAGLVSWEAGLSWPHADAGDRQTLLAALYRVMGQLLAANGCYGQALAFFGRGLAHTGEGAPPLARLTANPLRLDLAGVLLEKGDLAATAASLAELGPAIDPERTPGLYVRWLERRGQMAVLYGELSEALGHLDAVRRFCGRLGLHFAERIASLNLAHVLILLNQTAEAETLVQAVREEARATEDPALEARAELLLALSFARRQPPGVMPWAPPSSLEMRRGKVTARTREEAPGAQPLDLPQANNYLVFFEERTLAFQWYLRRRELAAAGAVLDRMEQTFSDTDSALVGARLEVLRGVLTFHVGELGVAESRLRAAAARLRAAGLRPDLRESLLYLSECRRLSGDEDGARDLRGEADELLAAMAASVSKELRGQYLIDKWSVVEERLADRIDELAALRMKALAGLRILRPFRGWRVLRNLDRLLHELDSFPGTRVDRAIDGQQPEGPRLRRDESARVRTAGALLRRLLTHPRDRATIGFVVLPDRTLVVRAGWLHLDFAVSPLTRIDLRHRVRRWYGSLPWAEGRSLRNLPAADLDRKLESIGARWREIGSEVARALQLPALLERLPARVRSLTLVPDDVLHGFPFAALSHQDQYLGARYRLVVDHHFAKPPGIRRQTPAERALLVGVARGTGSIPSLSEVGSEIEMVSEWTKKRGLESAPPPLIDDEASRDTLAASLPQADLWHIACHGVHEPDHPERTGFVLIPQPERVEVFTIADLSRLDLERLQHATLSSCWGADNFVLPGRQVVSLPEILRRQGAGSVLACLWEVDDRVAKAFMKSFYEHLEQQPRDEALRLARTLCIEKKLGIEGIDTSSPYYWAGFNLYGETEPLRFRS